MTAAGEHRLTDGDKGFLDGLVQRTTAIYAAKGGHQPIAYVERSDGRMAVLESNGLATEHDKEAFLNIVRYHSIRCASRRAAIVAESWAILDHDHDDETMMEVARFIEAGNRVSQHPLAREFVTVALESDAGVALQTLAIDRRVRDMAVLTPEGGPRVMPWTEGYESYGIFNNFHVRSAQRLNPGVIGWAAQMDRHLAAMVRDGAVEDVPRPVAN